MRTLYVGNLDPYGTCYSRLCSLRELEPEVHAFDVAQHLAWGRLPGWRRALEAHALRGPVLSRANAALEAACRELRPDIVWVDKGDWLQSSTLRRLRGLGCFLVHHITDSLEPHFRRLRLKRRRLRTTASDYDVFFTTNVDDHACLSKGAPPTALLTDLGYDPQRFEPSPLPDEIAKEWDLPLVFVGHYEPSTAEGILALIDAGLPVTVFGHAPWFSSKYRKRLGDHLRPELGNEDYVRALKGARIGLCFVSVWNYNQTASRSFEIPACGTFLLAVRTPQHSEAYQEGVEAEFFGDHRELVEKARYYLEHEDERAAIARRGHQRCVSSGYSWQALMKRDWLRVKEIYAERHRVHGGVS